MSNVVVGEVIIRTRFDSGKAKPEARKLEGSVKNLTKSARNLGTGFERMGRTISITGFVLGIVARRVIGSFQGIAQSIMKISEEGANLNKALEYIGTALEALALSGMLTDDVLARILATFNDMFNIALKSAGPWAIINDAIQKFKNAIAMGALPALTDLSNFLIGFDLTPFTNALSEATTTFLTPIIAKIKELLGDNENGVIGISEKLNAIALIGGSFLAGVLEGFDQILIKAAELIGSDQTGITGLASKLGEFAAWATVLAPAGAIIGMIVGGFGSIIRVVSSLVALFGGVTTGGLLLATAAIASDWERWSTEIIPDVVDAIGDLCAAIGFGDTDGLRGFLHELSVFVEGVVRGITLWIQALTAVIRKIRELTQVQANAPIGASYTPTIGEKQGGGMIARTGPYLLHEGERVVSRGQTYNNHGTNNFYIQSSDPRGVAEEVSKILSQQGRKAWMPI